MPVRDALRAQEEHLVTFARVATPRRFESDLLALCHRLDPAEVEADEHERETDTYLHASTITDGMVRVDALLPADIGGQLIALLESARRVLKAEQREKSADGELPAHLSDPRVQSQRNVEALRRILAAAASSTDESGATTLPAVNGSRPVVHVTIPLDSLLADSRDRAAGWLERYGVPTAAISAAKARLVACDGVVRPLIIDRSGNLIATLPTTRAVPPVMRRAVIMRDVHCRVPHCTARIDEVHRAIHSGTWSLVGDANSQLTLIHARTARQWYSHPPPSMVPD